MTLYSYRELYELNGFVEDLKKELMDIKGIEVYALQPLGIGFIEMNAPSEAEIKILDQRCTSRIISFCEKQKVEKHLLGPLKIF